MMSNTTIALPVWELLSIFVDFKRGVGSMEQGAVEAITENRAAEEGITGNRKGNKVATKAIKL